MKSLKSKTMCPDVAKTVNIFCFHFPQSPLRSFIERFWYWKGHTVSHSLEQILPTATVELVIDLGSARTSKSVISGPGSRSSIIRRTAQDELLGVHFKPGGAFPFLRLPLRELHNIHIGIDDLWREEQASQLLYFPHQAGRTERRFQYWRLGCLGLWLFYRSHVGVWGPSRHRSSRWFA